MRDAPLHVLDVHGIGIAGQPRLFDVEDAQKLGDALFQLREDAGAVVQRPVHVFQAQPHSLLGTAGADLAEGRRKRIEVAGDGVLFETGDAVEGVPFRAEQVRGSHRAREQAEGVRLCARVRAKQLRLKLRVENVHGIDPQIPLVFAERVRKLGGVLAERRQKDLRACDTEAVEHGESVLVELTQK